MKFYEKPEVDVQMFSSREAVTDVAKPGDGVVLSGEYDPLG